MSLREKEDIMMESKNWSVLVDERGELDEKWRFY